MPNINWVDPVLVSTRDYCSSLFSTFVSQFAFEQYVPENTRLQSIHPTAGSLLDIVLCNDAFAICDVIVSEPFSTSDHSSVYIFIVTKGTRPLTCTITQHTRSFKIIR